MALLAAAVMAASTAACRVSPTSTVAPSATASESSQISIPIEMPTADPAWPQTYHALAYDPVNAETLWFTYGRGILRNEAGGAGEWSAVQTTDTGGPILYALAYPATDALLAGGRGVFRISHDAGATWEPVADLGEAMVKGLTTLPGPQGGLIAFVDGRGVLRSDDAGATWSTSGPVPAELAFGIWVARADPLRLLTYDRGALTLLASDDAGASWEVLDADGLDAEVSAVALAPDGTAYAATDAGLFASGDGGDSWQPRGKAPPLVAVAVSPSDPDEITAIDANGRVFQSPDGGATW
jgi:photosystem II stability/assembly factor-like uncharacterized protein